MVTERLIEETYVTFAFRTPRMLSAPHVSEDRGVGDRRSREQAKKKKKLHGIMV